MKNLLIIIMLLAATNIFAQDVKVGVQAELSSPIMGGSVEGNPFATIKAGLGKGLGIEFVNVISNKLEIQYGVSNVRERYEAFDLHKDLDLISYDHSYIKIPFGIGIYDRKSYDNFYWKFNLSAALQVGTITMDDKFNSDIASIKTLPLTEKSTYYTFLMAGELSFNQLLGKTGQVKYSLAMNISPFKTNEISDSGMDFKLTSNAWPAVGVTYYPFTNNNNKRWRSCR